MPRYKLTIEYNGTNFCGWQRQKNLLSVQQLIEEAIEKFCGINCQIYCAGRTDAGVHAYGQVAHVDISKHYPEYTIMMAINHHLMSNVNSKNQIAIVNVELVSDEFHARFDAKLRSYQYIIVNRAAILILDHQRAWHISANLDIDVMQQAANYLLGTHDLTSFRAAECQAKSPIKTINDIKVIKENDNIIKINLVAPSFLHNQVRIIVGSLKNIGEGKWQAEYIKKILQSRDRSCAGQTAPACGLYFMQAIY
ncbi:MAG: tRNA pseudouridine(38-40) synthase TruA [Pseudomonadota bacterium]